MKNNKLFQHLAIFLAVSTPFFVRAEPLISAGEQAAKIIESDRKISLIKAQQDPRMAIVRMFRTAMNDLREDDIINSKWKLVARMSLEDGILFRDSKGLKCGGNLGTLKIDAAGQNFPVVAVDLDNVMCNTARLLGRFGPVEIMFVYSEKNDSAQNTTYECRLPDSDTLLCKTAEVIKDSSTMHVNDVGYLIFARTQR